MLRRIIAPALVATLALAACNDGGPTQPVDRRLQQQAQTDYALLMFGESGAALQGMMGPQDQQRPFDGQSSWRPFPDSLKLTEEQRAQIAALRAAFREEWGPELDSLRAIFQEARAAREAGATREEVHAILLEGRDLALRLRLAVIELHIAIWNVFTEQQKLWILAHRPTQLPPPIARP